MANLSKRETLWKWQQGKCAHCGKPLPIRGSHRHHMVPGSAKVRNMVLLHPRCHNKHVHGKHRVLVGALLLLASCVETGTRREELKPFDDGHYCMDLAHDCSLCGGKTLDSPCDSCFKYKALCK